MTNEQKEILNRVRLLMNYDMKNTLSENFSLINEQTAYERSLEKQGQPKKEEWTPNLKTIPGVLGDIEVPKETTFQTSTGVVKWGSVSGTDDKGQYITKADAKTRKPVIHEMFEQTKKCIGKNKEVVLDDNSKSYYPDKNWGSTLSGKVKNFTIPKGTLIPFLDEEGYDEWTQKPLDEDRTFRYLISLELDNFCKSILIDESDSSRGWKLYPDYYWERPDGVNESYVKTNYIEYRSPTKVFWDDYGLWIEIAGSVALTVLSGGLAAPLAAQFGVSRMTAGFVADFILNGIFNTGIAIAQYNWGDDQMAALALFFAFLPVIHKYSPITKWITRSNIQNLEGVSKSLMDKILKVKPQSAQEWKQFTKNLTKDEINLLSDVSKINKEEAKDLMTTVIKEATEKMTKEGVKPSVNFFSRLIPGWKGVIRGSKGLLSFGFDIAFIEAFNKTWVKLFGTMPRPGDYEALLIVMENLPEETRSEISELIESGQLDGKINLDGDFVSLQSLMEGMKTISDTIVRIPIEEPEKTQPEINNIENFSGVEDKNKEESDSLIQKDKDPFED